MEYAKLGAPNGTEDNMGGTTQRVFFAPLSWFAENGIKVPAEDGDLGTLVLIDDDHEFLDGKGWLQGYITADRGKLEAKSQGDADGKSFGQEFEFFYPGNGVIPHGLASMAKNDSFIFLVEMPDSRKTDGHYNQVGTEMFPAKLEAEFTSGGNASGTRGYTFKVKANSNRNYLYAGDPEDALYVEESES